MTAPACEAARAGVRAVPTACAIRAAIFSARATRVDPVAFTIRAAAFSARAIRVPATDVLFRAPARADAA
ncbi:hypothetical protein [Herbidospora daliensis]|uniref:hypothetical protein n=1 Tax=Herbidospora daliensis TaxID=295585 RepID=UPI0018DCC3A6|nr:hypothetical protein [Herbidospora daliensis]